MRERRKSPRVDFDLKLKIFSDEENTKLVVENCGITNISNVGISFVSHKKFEIGQNFYMKFELLGGLIISFLGEICWRKGTKILYSYGVRYIKLGWLSKRNLETGFMEKYYPQEKTKLRVLLEYVLLILLVVLLSRFLNQLPVAYTIGIFLCFAGVFYFVMLRSRF